MKSEDWDFDTIELWAMVLTDLRITKSEFELAKRKSCGLTWLPTAPADFLALARNGESFPDSRKAYLDAANGIYEHGVALETAKRVGFDAMRMQPEKYTFPQWEKHYKAVKLAAGSGQSFDLVRLPQIENKTQQRSNTNVLAKADIERLKLILKKGE